MYNFSFLNIFVNDYNMEESVTNMLSDVYANIWKLVSNNISKQNISISMKFQGILENKKN